MLGIEVIDLRKIAEFPGQRMAFVLGDQDMARKMEVDRVAGGKPVEGIQKSANFGSRLHIDVGSSSSV